MKKNRKQTQVAIGTLGSIACMVIAAWYHNVPAIILAGILFWSVIMYAVPKEGDK